MKRRLAYPWAAGFVAVLILATLGSLLFSGIRNEVAAVLLTWFQRSPTAIAKLSSLLLALDAGVLVLFIVASLLWIFRKPLRQASVLLTGGAKAPVLAPLILPVPGRSRGLLVGAVLLFAVLAGARLWLISDKDGLHIDESTSVNLAAYSHSGHGGGFPLNTPLSGEAVKLASFWSDPSVGGALRDVAKLWLDNRDAPHTNFYYSLLRLSAIGLKTGDLETIIWRGCLLNLVLFALSYYLLFVLAARYFKDPLVVLSLLAVAFANTASVSSTLFLRPYQLQETMFVLVTSLFLDGFSRSRAGSPLESWPNLFRTAFILALTLLSGYFSAILIVFFGLFLTVDALRKRDFSLFLFWMIALAFSLVLTTVLYPRYLLGFFSGRAAEAAGKIGLSGMGDNFSESFAATMNLLSTHLFSFPFLVLLGIQLVSVLVSKKSSETPPLMPLFLVAGASLAWCFLAMGLAPFKTLRYVMAAFPLLALGVFVVFLRGPLMLSRITAGASAVLVCALLTINLVSLRIPIDRFPAVEFLFSGKKQDFRAAFQSTHPVVVLNSQTFKYSDLVPYLDSNGTYYFVKDLESAKALFKPGTQVTMIVEKPLYEGGIQSQLHSPQGTLLRGYFVVVPEVDAGLF